MPVCWCLQWWLHTSNSYHLPSEPERVRSGDVATSKALIGSRIFCREVRATHRENSTTVAGLFGKTAHFLPFLPWTNCEVQTFYCRWWLTTAFGENMTRDATKKRVRPLLASLQRKSLLADAQELPEYFTLESHGTIAKKTQLYFAHLSNTGNAIGSVVRARAISAPRRCCFGKQRRGVVCWDASSDWFNWQELRNETLLPIQTLQN